MSKVQRKFTIILHWKCGRLSTIQSIFILQIAISSIVWANLTCNFANVCIFNDHQLDIGRIAANSIIWIKWVNFWCFNCWTIGQNVLITIFIFSRLPVFDILQKSFNQLTKLIHSMRLLSGSIHFFFSRYTRCVCVLVAMNQEFSWWNRYALELWLKTVIETIYTYVGQFINQIALILNELRVDVRTFWMPVYTVYSVVCMHTLFVLDKATNHI